MPKNGLSFEVADHPIIKRVSKNQSAAEISILVGHRLILEGAFIALVRRFKRNGLSMAAIGPARLTNPPCSLEERARSLSAIYARPDGF